ncbi:pentapeptide repeat-containing protein [Nonomuraea sp. FMUSA5-5]|uniref:Pentapeptide repeat-containing protein n=1 Tax=Nonomuraea composti TaxID=2720023 RepID=A0ABX1BQC7_9ACTN|nr:pentapeptide repeat-containing protein [Nonomuraea sp. FMUSA5-5]NJP98789.1 pentapeptide repeat-containing protein [Nonomuraea sp. FMUSA5-5]
MKPRSIAVAVAGALLVVAIIWMLGPGASWWLQHVDRAVACTSRTDLKTVGVTCLSSKDWVTATDSVRGRALAVATGLAALLAVYYTARNADTARRTFQLGERGHDTDRYSKAADQLGHDKAPVRLAGLYALEELAQNNPRLRQTIADVLCAYLRMPCAPPEEPSTARNPAAEEADRRERIRAAQRKARSRTTEMVSGPPTPDPLEEHQVRLTAQRILTDHLRSPSPRGQRWRPRVKRPPGTFWPRIRLDLTGALLVDLDFRGCQVSDSRFDGATFRGNSKFYGAVFHGNVSFEQATFHGVHFDGAVFHGQASFELAAFRYGATFSGAVFNSDALFGWSAFMLALFQRATFQSDALFDEVGFHNGGSFEEVTFSGRSSFDGATFGAGIRFDQKQRVDLDGASVEPHAMRVEHRWPLGWLVEPDGKGGGLLRPDSPPEQNADPRRPETLI